MKIRITEINSHNRHWREILYDNGLVYLVYKDKKRLINLVGKSASIQSYAKIISDL